VCVCVCARVCKTLRLPSTSLMTAHCAMEALHTCEIWAHLPPLLLTAHCASTTAALRHESVERVALLQQMHQAPPPWAKGSNWRQLESSRGLRSAASPPARGWVWACKNYSIKNQRDWLQIIKGIWGALVHLQNKHRVYACVAAWVIQASHAYTLAVFQVVQEQERGMVWNPHLYFLFGLLSGSQKVCK